MTDLDALKAQVAAAQASYDQAVQVLWGLVLFELAFMTGVVVHELGHAVMARRARLPVRMVRIGTGPVLLRCRFGQAWFVVRALPFSGAVLALVPRMTTLDEAAGFLLGGIGGNAVVLAGAALAWALDGGTGWWSLPVMAAQAVLILVAAVPYTWRMRGLPQRSDGARLLRLFRDGALWSEARAQEAIVQRLGLTEPVPPPSSAWPEIVYQVTRPDRLREGWARRDACAVLHALQDDPGLTWFERLLVHEELILQEAHHGDGITTPAELDTWSAAAFKRAPTAMLQVARAGALFRLGRWDEAEALLGPWTEAAPGRAGLQAQQVAARLRIARSYAELDALRSGDGQVRLPVSDASTGESRTS